jgi:hypothetical protein
MSGDSRLLQIQTAFFVIEAMKLGIAAGSKGA